MAKLANNRAIKYFIEAKEELQKVSWPTQKQTVQYTLQVIAITVLLGAFFGLADAVFNLGLSELISASLSSPTQTIQVAPSVNDIEVTTGSEPTITINEENLGTEETPADATDSGAEESAQ